MSTPRGPLTPTWVVTVQSTVLNGTYGPFDDREAAETFVDAALKHTSGSADYMKVDPPRLAAFDMLVGAIQLGITGGLSAVSAAFKGGEAKP